MDPRGLIGNNGGNNPYQPGNNPHQPGNNQFVGGGGINHTQGGNTPGNLGPDFYVPPQIDPKTKGKTNVNQSINSINDIDYYPEMDANPALFNKQTFNDPDFDQICERLRKGL